MGRLAFYLPVAGFLALALLLWRGLFLDPKELPSMLIDKPMPQFQLRTVDGETVTNANLPEQIFSSTSGAATVCHALWSILLLCVFLRKVRYPWLA